MLRLAKLADYGLLIASTLANQDIPLLKLEQVADTTHLPVPTVRKLMKLLVDGGVVHSERGVKGGYTLAKPANAISVAEVIRSVEGDVALTDCCRDDCSCEVVHTCTVQSNWSVMNDVVSDIFQRVTLADMLRPMTKKDVLAKAETDRIGYVSVEG